MLRVSFFRSLPVRLAGLTLLLSGFSLVVLTEINRRAVERILLNQSEVQAMLSTIAVTDGIDAVTGAAERLTRSIARELEDRPATPAQLAGIAHNLLINQPALSGFSLAFEPRALDALTERAGVYVHRSSAANRLVTRDLSSPDQTYWTRDWYREVIDKGLPIWSEPFFDQNGADRNVVRIAVPVFRSASERATPIGVAAAVIDLEWLRRLTNLNEFADTGFTIIFSRTGRLILHPRPNYAIAETIETLAQKENTPELITIRQSILSRRQGASSYRDTVLQRRVHVNYKPAKIAGWGVIVGYHEEEFLKDQRAYRWSVAGFLGATLVVLAGIVIGVTRSALRPLPPLAEAAGEIARQNLDCKIPEPVREDEIGRLARAFCAMRDALKAQHLERRWAGRALEHQLKYNNLIIDSIGELVFVVTKTLSITRINPAVTNVGGHALHNLMRAPLGRVVRLTTNSAHRPPDDLFAAALKEGRSLHDMAAELVTKDGTLLAGRMAFVPFVDANQVVGAVITLRLDPPATTDAGKV